uniref:Tat pathway signal sequence n=1 Tax=Fusarium oxysporum (strain Fo5176) TaxID=660025 RepID=A0A0D2YIB3_FUSOF
MAHKEAISPFNPHVDGNSSDEESDSFHYVPPTRRRRLSLCRCFGWAITLLSIILISAFAGAWISMVYVNIDQICTAHTSQWSPLLDNIAIKYKMQPFDGNFMRENIFRGNASPEVDAAWEALGVDYRPGVISYKDGLSSGLDDSFVQRAPQHGGGFIVNNLLRKSLWYNYEYYKDLGGHAFKNDGEVFRMHVILMCNVDTGVLGQVWVNPKNPNAFPDFNTRHVCKNYNDVREWAEKLQAPPTSEIPDDYLLLPKNKDILESTP